MSNTFIGNTSDMDEIGIEETAEVQTLEARNDAQIPYSPFGDDMSEFADDKMQGE